MRNWLAQGLVEVLYPHRSRTPSSQEATVNLIHGALGLLSVNHILLMIPITIHARGGLQQIGPIERESMPFAGHAIGGAPGRDSPGQTRPSLKQGRARWTIRRLAVLEAGTKLEGLDIDARSEFKELEVRRRPGQVYLPT